ncbi:hypothetical protein Bca4012_046220 [Brassica carinata]
MGDEFRADLLEKQYHEGCPGCLVDKMKEVRRGYPYAELSFIWIIILTTSLPISSLYPFLYYMIQDFGVAKTEQEIGYYAGFIACAFMLGRALTSVLWGVMSDRYGRKPIILLGTITIAVFNALFGMSTNIWMAIATRFMLGSFNCLLGTIKAYAMEIFREEYQATAMSAVSTAWGIGLIIGPALGGFLSQPAEKYPSVFTKASFFGRFPYALPCFTISAFALVVTAICCFIPETLHNHELDNKTSDDDSVEALEAASLETAGMTGNNKRTSLFKNWPLMSSILVYCVLCLHDTAYSEIFALWANSPSKFGGLGYSTNHVGTVLTISGPPISSSRETAGTSAPYPSSRGTDDTCPDELYLYSSSVSAITGMLILQNRAVDQHQRGAANGLAMTSMSLFKTVAPVVSGFLFSWSEERQNASFLPGPQMLFFFLNVIVILAVCLTFRPFLVTAARRR